MNYGVPEAIRVGDWKLRRATHDIATPQIELFNLKDDPRERTNLVSAYPEKMKTLTELLDKYNGNSSN